MPLRELFFYTVLIGGGIALAGLYWPAWSREAKPSSPLAQSKNAVEELLSGSSLSPEERRRWLDRFLQEQQEEEKK